MSVEVEAPAVDRSLSPAMADETAAQPVEAASEGVISGTSALKSGNSLAGTDDTSVITTILPPSEQLRPADANNSLISDSSGGDSIMENSLITKEMMEEEKMLHQENVEDEQEMMRQQQKSMEGFTAEDRYNRLKSLLTKSKLYSTYLAERMQKQAAEEAKRKERMQKKAAREAEKKDKEGQQGDQEQHKQNAKGRRTLRNKSNNDNSSQSSQNDSQSSQANKRKGRKRKVADSDQENSPKIDDFFSGSKKKRQKKNEELDEPEMPPSPILSGLGETKEIKSGENTPNQNTEPILEGQPKLFEGGALRQYQLDGFRWLKGLYENGINGILADEMGLGKTIQCIALVAHLVEQNINGPFLVCGPLSTVPNWFAEFQRFAPKVPVILYHGSKDERAKLRTKINPRYAKKHNLVLPVLVTSYEIVMNDRNFLMDKDWKLLIVDEGHRIKNFQCKLISDLKMYQSTHRLLLTGTPLQNNLSELWSLLNFLLPEIFDDLGSFEAWFDFRSLGSSNAHEEIVKTEQKNNILSTIHQILMPFMLRRLKTDVALAIPPKREVLVYAPMTAKQQEMYKAAVDKTIRSLLGVEEEENKCVEIDTSGRPIRRNRTHINYNEMEGNGNEEDAKDDDNNSKTSEDDDMEKWVMAVQKQQRERQERFNAMSYGSSTHKEPEGALVKVQLRNIMSLLRKSCNHPYLIEYPLTPGGEFKIDSNLIKASGKFLILDKMLPELKKRGSKVLIFSQMTSMLDILYDYCYLKNWKSCRLDGSMRLDDRKEQISSFNTDPDVFIFLVSTRAGGLGINLTAADTCIIFDSDWNPQCDLQAQDRCHRIGQTKPVMVYRLVTANTIDQKIVERAAAKRKLEKMVIHKGQFKTGINEGANAYKAISPEELYKLLKEMDYDTVMKEQSVISDADLARLLDRSDLEKVWAQRKAAEAAANNESAPSETKSSQDKTAPSTPEEPQDVQGVFKIIDEELGNNDNLLPSMTNTDALNVASQESPNAQTTESTTLAKSASSPAKNS